MDSVSKFTKFNCSIISYRQWEEHPFTKLLMQILEKAYYEQAAEFTATIYGTGDEVALKTAAFQGRQQLLSEFIHKREFEDDTVERLLKINVLDDYIEWEEDVEKERQRYAEASRKQSSNKSKEDREENQKWYFSPRRRR